MKRLSIYFTRTHTSIAVEHDNGTVRDISNRDIVQVVTMMDSEDRDMLVRFSKAIIECAQGDCKRLNEW